jgi:DHA1 family multidrug resistance protein-like MFS transporter
MEGFFRTTPFGKLLRFVSGNALLRYPDEADSTLWKASVEQAELSTASLKEKSGGEGEGASPAAPVPDGQNGASTSESDVILVGWYGPNDPEVSSPHHSSYR